jgi:rhodanese-related sulfurtransferase
LVDSRGGSITGVIGGASAISGSSVGGVPHPSSVVENGSVSNGGGAKSTSSGTTAFEMPERCTTVSGDVAKSIVQSGATLLDVREPSEFAAFALDEAINIPVGSLTAQMSELNAVKPVVVYCKSGGRAAQAMTLLCDAGYEVFSLGAMSNYPN